MTTRRILLKAWLALPALGWVRFSSAQRQTRIPRIGFLSSISPDGAARWVEALKTGLGERGWMEGKNIVIEYRYAHGKVERLQELAQELVGLKVDVIVAAAQSEALMASKATRTLPIVMAAPGDPVAAGLVAGLAKPGGNVTGLTQMAPELSGKRLELLRETKPKIARVAVLWNPKGGTSPFSWKELQLPARQLGMSLQSMEASTAGDLDKAFDAISKYRPDGLIVLSNPVMLSNLKRIVDFAGKQRLPSMYQLSEYVDAGGLMSYGPDRIDMYRRSATYVDKILKGAKPSELPVEQATKFDLVINMKTAKALGITMPPTVMIRATRVIE